MTRRPFLNLFRTIRMAALTAPPVKFTPPPVMLIPPDFFLRRLLRKPAPWGALAHWLSMFLLISAHVVPLPFFLRRLLRKAPVPEIRIPLPFFGYPPHVTPERYVPPEPFLCLCLHPQGIVFIYQKQNENKILKERKIYWPVGAQEVSLAQQRRSCQPVCFPHRPLRQVQQKYPSYSGDFEKDMGDKQQGDPDVFLRHEGGCSLSETGYDVQ